MHGFSGRILLLDDVELRRQLVCTRLAARGHTVLAESTKHDPSTYVDSFVPDAVVVELDHHAPAPIVSRLRASRPVRIVFIASASSSSADRVAATRAGADAVLVEPFAIDELVATVETMMSWAARRSRLRAVHDLEIDERAHQVTRDGIELSLTVTEFKLLLAMVDNVGIVMSKRTLLEQVWGFGDYDPNVVEVHICSLRRKLHLPGRIDFIETVRGVGYVIRAGGRTRTAVMPDEVGAG